MNIEQLREQRQCLLAEIGHYFVRSYDCETYDDSMRALVDALNEVEDDLADAELPTTEDPNEIPDWKYAEEAERRHES